MLIYVTKCFLTKFLISLTCLIAQDTQVEDQKVTRPLRGIVTMEDGSPAVGFDVKIAAQWEIFGPDPVVAQTSNRGTFVIQVPPGPHNPMLIASSPDKELLGISDSFTQDKLIRIVMKPKHVIKCSVKDKAGNQIEGADVGVIVQYVDIVRSRTDASGQCEITVPADSKIDWIYGRKSNLAFDYYEHYTVFPTQTRPPVPEQVELTLGESTAAAIRVVDENDKPVPNVRLAPWTIDCDKKLSYCNLSGSMVLSEKTDENGVAKFTWLPKKHAYNISLLVLNRELRCGDFAIRAGSMETPPTITVTSLPRVSGIVRQPDGTPAAGVNLQGESSGSRYFRGYTKTNSKGEYSFDIYPDQSTSIEITDKQWAGVAQSVTLKTGENKSDLDFKLIDGATISGTISSEDDTPVAAGTHITIISGGRVCRWIYVNDLGKYFARLGPGEYQVQMPNDESESISVKEGDEIVRDGIVKKTEKQIVFEGSIVDRGGTPVAGVFMDAAGTNSGRVGYHGKSNLDGKFWLERMDRTMFICRDSKRNLACLKIVDVGEKKATFELEASANLKGRLLNEKGTQPLVESEVQFKVTAENFQEISISTWTDDDGNFDFGAIPSGVKGKLQVLYTRNPPGDLPSIRVHLSVQGPIEFKRPELKNLGDVKVKKAE